jgi:predicted DNA repair protein MutK
MAAPVDTWQEQVFAALITDTRAAIALCGYTHVYCAVACAVFADDVGHDVARAAAWLTAQVERTATACARRCDGLRTDYAMAIEWFGYDAVYFGVGVVVFPEAVDFLYP